jgi:drug efflux transport system permease protein
MNWHRMAAMARKEVIQIVRDWRSFAIVAAMPIVMTLLYGYGVSLDIKHIPMYVFDRESSQQSQELLKAFQASQYFHVLGTENNYRAIIHHLDAGDCKFALVIPWDFSQRLQEGRTVRVQSLIDGTDNNMANIIIGYAGAVINTYSEKVQLQWLRIHGQPEIRYPIKIDARTWFNEDLESRAFIVPGVIAIVMAVIGTFLTSLTISREWERGTMEQLVSTPVTALEVIVGKLIPYFVIGLVATAMCSAIGVFWFEIPFRGSVGTLFLASFLFLAVVLGMGFWISAAARSQLVASQIAIVATFMPAFLLSGFIFPIDQMPVVLRAITYIVPARYYDTIMKSVFLKGLAVSTMTNEFAALVIYSAIVAVMAVRSFHKSLD